MHFISVQKHLYYYYAEHPTTHLKPPVPHNPVTIWKQKILIEPSIGLLLSIYFSLYFYPFNSFTMHLVPFHAKNAFTVIKNTLLSKAILSENRDFNFKLLVSCTIELILLLETLLHSFPLL